MVCRTGSGNLWLGCRGGACILFLGHFLVLRRGRRGLCDVIPRDRACVLGHDQMVRAGRHPVCKPVDCAHIIPYGTVHRHPSAEPARHTCPCIPLLLQETGGCRIYFPGIREDICHRLHYPGHHTLHSHSFPAEDRSVRRPVLRERARSAFQYWCRLLHGSPSRAVLLGAFPYDEEREGIRQHRASLLHYDNHRVLHILDHYHQVFCQDTDQRVPAGQSFHFGEISRPRAVREQPSHLRAVFRCSV